MLNLMKVWIDVKKINIFIWLKTNKKILILVFSKNEIKKVLTNKLWHCIIDASSKINRWAERVIDWTLIAR